MVATFTFQLVAELSFNMVSPLSSKTERRRLAAQKLRRYRLRQPADFREGMSSACEVIKEVSIHKKMASNFPLFCDYSS